MSAPHNHTRTAWRLVLVAALALAGARRCEAANDDLAPAGAHFQFDFALARINPILADLYTELGHALLAEGNFAGARAAYGEAARREPTDARPHRYIGDAFFYRRDFAGAVIAYRKAVELDPRHAGLRNNLGSALLESGDVPGAIAQFEAAVKLDPNHLDARANLDRALRAKQYRENRIAPPPREVTRP